MSSMLLVHLEDKTIKQLETIQKKRKTTTTLATVHVLEAADGTSAIVNSLLENASRCRAFSKSYAEVEPGKGGYF